MAQIERLFSPKLQTIPVPTTRFLKSHVPKKTWQTWNYTLDQLNVDGGESQSLRVGGVLSCSSTRARSHVTSLVKNQCPMLSATKSQNPWAPSPVAEIMVTYRRPKSSGLMVVGGRLVG